MGGCTGEKSAPPTDSYTVLHVSVGKTDGGYRSLQQALAAAVKLRRENPGIRLKIQVDAGDYYIDTPLQVGADLSGTPTAPTIIAATTQNQPRLLSGRVLRLTWAPYREGIFQARLADGPSFDQFFVDGKRQVRARYPNSGYAPDALSPARVSRWRDPTGAIVHAIHEHRWGGMQIPVAGKHADGTLVFGAAVGNNRPSAPHATDRYVENVFEELDAPGEWYYRASDSMLFYIPPPGMDMSRAEFAVSGPARIFELQGTPRAPVRFVRIEGFELQRTGYSFLQSAEPLLRSDWMIAREGATFIENAEDVTIARNTLSWLGGNGVFASGYGRHVTITGNHIHHIGGSGISFTGRPVAVRSPQFQYQQFASSGDLDLAPGPKSPDYPAESAARDNLIHDIGMVEKQVAGVQISMAMNIRVAHNTIYRAPRAGINIGDGTWGGHLIEHNEVFDTVLETGDHGAFNSWGRDRFWHPDRAIMDAWSRENPGLWKLDVIAPIVLRNNRFRCDHGWDIDLDDGSSNYRIHDNVLLAGGLKTREGFDRRVWNNVLVNNGFHPHMGFEASGDRFERNIVMAAHEPISMQYRDAVVDFNLFPTRCTLEQAQRLGLDSHSRYGDAQFRDPARGDFRVEPGSPALALGFENFPMTEFGVTSEWLKRLAAHAPISNGQQPVASSNVDARCKSLTP